MKILVISLAGIGDTLFATPLIHELRVHFPAARIDAFVRWAPARDALGSNPHLNFVHQKDFFEAGKTDGLGFLWQLRAQRYDVSINTHPQSRTEYRLVARFINARTRISHEYDNARWIDRWLVNRTLPQDYERHSIENNLALLGCLGAEPRLPAHRYEIYLDSGEVAWAEDYIGSEGLGGRGLIGIHVGSGGTKNLALRRWPVGHYLELIRQLNRLRPEHTVLLFGGREEAADNARLLAEAGGERVRCPRTRSLRQTAALLGRCESFLSVDTALMHLAAAMKVRNQVVIETPTWNPPIAPYGQPFVLVPNPDVHGRNLDYYRYDGRGIRGSDEDIRKCMASVRVDDVMDALVRGLPANAAPPGAGAPRPPR
jgi:heptosyltransferase-2